MIAALSLSATALIAFTSAQVYDADGSGQLDEDEFLQVMKAAGWSEEDALAAFSEVDTDRGGSVELHEFEIWWEKNQVRAAARLGSGMSAPGKGLCIIICCPCVASLVTAEVGMRWTCTTCCAMCRTLDPSSSDPSQDANGRVQPPELRLCALASNLERLPTYMRRYGLTEHVDYFIACMPSIAAAAEAAKANGCDELLPAPVIRGGDVTAALNAVSDAAAAKQYRSACKAIHALLLANRVLLPFQPSMLRPPDRATDTLGQAQVRDCGCVEPTVAVRIILTLSYNPGKRLSAIFPQAQRSLISAPFTPRQLLALYMCMFAQMLDYQGPDRAAEVEYLYATAAELWEGPNASSQQMQPGGKPLPKPVESSQEIKDMM